jgi:hypothetical protein
MTTCPAENEFALMQEPHPPQVVTQKHVSISSNDACWKLQSPWFWQGSPWLALMAVLRRFGDSSFPGLPSTR